MKKKSVLDLKRISQEEFKRVEKISLTVILDNVRSLNNIGSVFRTADAFRVECIYLCGITATPPHTEDSVDWVYFQDTCEAVDNLLAAGYEVYAIEQVEGSISLTDIKLDKNKKYAVVLGNEVKCVHHSVLHNIKKKIEIPQFGTKHSLNVSVTAGLVIWDFFKQLGI